MPQPKPSLMAWPNVGAGAGAGAAAGGGAGVGSGLAAGAGATLAEDDERPHEELLRTGLLERLEVDLGILLSC